jgi:GAF domain-containing protein
MNAALHALARAAVDVTGAGAGAVLAVAGDDLVVVAAAGDCAGLVGTTVAATGTSAAFVVSSGQPIAVSVRPEDPVTSAVAALLGRHPASVLCVPCATDEDPLGALELVDKAGGMFTVDDIELATVLAGIAGAALTERGQAAAPPAPPSWERPWPGWPAPTRSATRRWPRC